MNEFEKSALNKVVRGPNRATYSKADVYKIVDSHFLCHLAYVYEDTPIVIPTGYGRKGDVLYVHGSSKNRMLNYLLENEKVSATITHMDGIVLAKSVFHHSFNYRSAVLFGKPRLISDEDEKMEALKIITDNIIEGRWEEARYPIAKEMKATMVMAIDIADASAKIRAEGANDDLIDTELDVWTGVLPLTVEVGQPEPNDDCNPELAVPKSVVNFKF
jgi:uncharacterized protein